ncbi:hypothetical protein CEXT_303321 [Caerostris extrusa]|uniref:Nuclear receptor domain-containing protein n=1 Tax=Caerostris extrusa TaxID=172846 RepID=A0AAV4QD23_CAEEX|nr:hypothetical protein CEXT_303321 [Caerostris extrusa]
MLICMFYYGIASCFPQGHEREGGGVVSRVRRQGVGASLRRAQLRRMQGLLQAQCAAQPGVRVQGAGALRGGRGARRNQCQACRLKKCLAVCMRKEGELLYCLF